MNTPRLKKKKTRYVCKLFAYVIGPVETVRYKRIDFFSIYRESGQKPKETRNKKTSRRTANNRNRCLYYYYSGPFPGSDTIRNDYFNVK